MAGVTLFVPSTAGWAQLARAEDATHLSVSTTDARGRVGDTVSIRVTVKNHGPLVAPEWALTGVETQEGTQFVSGTGCRRDTSNGGQYCASPGPLPVGASLTVVLRYKIVRTVAHPDWLFAGFGLYEALSRKGGTDDVDLNFQIYIEGTAKPASRAPAAPTKAPARSAQSQAPSTRATATPEAAGTPSATPSSAPTAAVTPAAPTTGPAIASAPDLARISADQARTGVAGWVAAAAGVVVIGVAALILFWARRRGRSDPLLSTSNGFTAGSGPADEEAPGRDGEAP
jgi:hypothetical protein